MNEGNSLIKERNRLESLNHPDLIWIEPNYLHQGSLIPKSMAKRESLNLRTTPQIRLNQIREIKRFLGKQPIEARLGMVVIEGVEMMNEAAANALLKTLEEPENGLLILISERPECLLQTIRSRCIEIPFSRLKEEDLKIVLSKINVSKEMDLSIGFNQKELIKLSNGSPGSFIENLQAWQGLPSDIRIRLQKLPQKPIEALTLAREIIETLDVEKQIWTINWLQQYLWAQNHKPNQVKRLDILRSQIVSYVQPRLAWEVALLNLIQ